MYMTSCKSREGFCGGSLCMEPYILTETSPIQEGTWDTLFSEKVTT